jgi:hypothetical protein
MIARHTPALESKRVTRLITVDVALLGHVGDAIAELTYEHNWEEIGDPVSDVVTELHQTLESYYQDSMIGKIDQFINTPPAAWLEFDGTTYDEEDYPELTEIIPAGWRAGGNFTLPDLAGYFNSFVGSSGTPGATSGSNSFALTEGQLPAHTHTEIPAIVGVEVGGAGAPLPSAEIGAPIASGSTGSGEDVDNRPLHINFILAIFSGRAI